MTALYIYISQDFETNPDPHLFGTSLEAYITFADFPFTGTYTPEEGLTSPSTIWDRHGAGHLVPHLQGYVTTVNGLVTDWNLFGSDLDSTFLQTTPQLDQICFASTCASVGANPGTWTRITPDPVPLHTTLVLVLLVIPMLKFLKGTTNV